MANPRVSVCIPVYNLEHYIAEALDSLKAQTYQDYEAIIVNDGSTDRSEEIIAPYLEDPRLQYIRQENGGVAKARETAVAAAKGEWFAHLDGDDLWTPDKLERQIALADSDRRTNLIYGNAIVFYEDGSERVFYAAPMPEGDIIRALYVDCFLCTSTVMVKTADVVAVGYPILKYGEDYTLWLRIARRGVWARYCASPIVRYRIRGSSQASPRLANLQAQVVIMNTALSHEDRPHLARILRRGIRRIKRIEAYELARLAARTGDGDIERLLWRAWYHGRHGYKCLLMAMLCSLSRIAHIRGGREFVVRQLRQRTQREISEQNASA
jgi:GT2 family glycosyltransferase